MIYILNILKILVNKRVKKIKCLLSLVVHEGTRTLYLLFYPLKRGVTKYGLAPHKPILLLPLVDHNYTLCRNFTESKFITMSIYSFVAVLYLVTLGIKYDFKRTAEIV